MPVSRLQPSPDLYPDAEAHRRRWRSLARAIAARGATISDDPAAITPPAQPGMLEILGSGIEAIGFTRADEARIRAADEVFFCVADPATKLWLLDQRPDAYDLYALYDDSKRRYVTYMQMAEAMLHPVRDGRHVVAIFYGHPGIFVLATHRAVKIARREGHRAEMRAAVSALDTLCADLGVDPSQPGMQMYEATDMLIRARRPDPGLHLVLWQVGLIGELGYRRQGYLNSNFAALLDYLEPLYGPDHPVVNYVGSRYPGVEPLIDRQTIASLRDPAVQSWVTGISTFYLPPRAAAPADPAMLARLGLLQPGQSVQAGTDPLRVIDQYGPRERRAFTDFARFDVPQSYQWQPDSAAARFVVALCEDPALRDAYRRDPAAAVAQWPGLAPRERALLARREAGAIQLAAKGLRGTGEPENRRLFEKLIGRGSTSAALLAAVRSAPAGEARAAAERWLRANAMPADFDALAADFQQLLRRDLGVWTGLYLAPGRELALSVFGRPGGGTVRVDLNGVRIQQARFEKGVLVWSAGAGNASSGYLQPDLTPRGARRWVGLIWPAGAGPDAVYKLVLDAHEAGQQPGDFNALPDATALAGEYRLIVQHGPLAEVVPATIAAGAMTIGGAPVSARIGDGRVAWEGGSGKLASGTLELVCDPVTGRPLAHGSARSAAGTTVALRGMMLIDDATATALAAAPRLGLPDWAWRPLVAMMAGASRKGGLFLWHGYARTGTSLSRVRRILARLHRDGARAEASAPQSGDIA